MALIELLTLEVIFIHNFDINLKSNTGSSFFVEGQEYTPMGNMENVSYCYVIQMAVCDLR
jgi:hypothetical protein